MWYSLHSFYCSKEFSDLKNRIIYDRTTDDGEIICEHCGKPIADRKDLIFHHKEFLTVENVNDYDISLNPDLIDCVHFNCHNEIHERWGKYNQHIYIVYGPPLSGKTTWVKDKATKDDLVIDMDIIRSAITGARLYDRSGYTTNDVFAVRDLLIDRIRTKATRAKNIFIIGGYPHARDREELSKKLNAELVYMDVSKEECLFRLENQNDKDKSNWMKYIDDWFFKYHY